MEAPEKIYIHPDIGGREFLRPWLHRPANDESIEYTRTDAFIEKACKFLKYYRQDTCDGTGYIAGIVNDKTIDAFKEYMKGE